MTPKIEKENQLNHLFNQVSEISSKIDGFYINPNLENTKIKKYLDAFKLLKTDIKDLLDVKDPISFILKLKNIKDKLLIHIENLIDYIENEFDNLNLNKTQKNELLYDLGFDKFLLNEDIKEYIKNSKFFYEELYFEVYALIDSDFKYFIQKIFSLKDDKNIINEILKDIKYKKYKEFILFIQKNNLNIFLSSENSFGKEIFKQIFELEINSEEKIILLEKFYNFFNIKGIENIKYSKLVKLNNLINFDTINSYKKEEINQYNDIISNLDELILNKEQYDFDFYIKIFQNIQEVSNSKHRGYLWGYTRNKIKENFSFSINYLNFDFYVNKKYDENFWIQNRLNYRVKLRNDESKLEKYELMDGFNQFRNIILNIQDAFLSDFYKIYIFNILIERLALNKSTYNNFKFFMFFVLPKNYLEYCKIYTFFFEYENLKNNNSYAFLKLTIISLLFFTTFVFYSTFYFSWIFSFGLLLFLIGQYLKNHNFLLKKPEVRFHFGFNFFGLLIIFFYGFVFLGSNGVLELKIDFLEKINKNEIVWQKLDTNILKKTGYIIADVLQNNNINK